MYEWHFFTTIKGFVCIYLSFNTQEIRNRFRRLDRRSPAQPPSVASLVRKTFQHAFVLVL